jgi:NADH-quinone oxidoreductase subunit N
MNIIVNLIGVLPMVVLSLVALLIILVDALYKENARISFWLALAGTVATFFVTFNQTPQQSVFNGMVLVDGFTRFCTLVLLCGTFLTILLSRSYLEKMEIHFGEYYALILSAVLGMMFLASAGDLMMIFVGIELMSVCFYVLAGFMRKRSTSNESALKYFLLGAFATGFLLYGIALLYGASGTTNISAIVSQLDSLQTSILFWIGIGLLLIGFAFKVAAVPFHMWAPDVYEGAPTSVTAFMATTGKTAAFSGLLLVFANVVGHTSQNFSHEKISLALAVVSAASMILGNVVAISQTNIKRMLAYSSIAHAGYMLAGLASGTQYGVHGILFYLAAYTLMNLGAFGVISLVEQIEEKNLSLNDYAGFSQKQPVLAGLMAIFMFSLSGIPPFAGFFGKYYVFAAAVSGGFTWLAIVGVLTSAIAAYYYLRIVVLMYFKNSETEIAVSTSRISFAAISLAAIGVVLFGMFPSLLTDLITKSW